MKEKYTFNPGDKIFAKVKGFVYWPARVNPIPDEIQIPPNKIPIFFYGTHEVYFISPSSCWPYDEKHKTKWGKPHARAHFNLGMDEIENNPTLFQYGADPKAEDYLAQFYQFKTSNGELSSGQKCENNESIISDNKSAKSKKETVKKRTSVVLSSKKNKDDANDKIERTDEFPDVVKLNSNNKDCDNDEKIDPKILQEIEISIVKENLDQEICKGNITYTPSDHSHEENMPKLRSKSSNKKAIKRKLPNKDVENSDDASDSEDVSSDNLEDEDFQPAIKSARVSKKSVTKIPKAKKAESKPNASKKQKSVIKIAKVSKPKKETKNVASDIDSLSSISSIDDWKEKDEKRRKEHEEMVKKVHTEELLKEEKAIKEASKLARKKSRSRSNVAEDEQKGCVQTLTNNVTKDDIKEDIFDCVVKMDECISDSTKNEPITNKDELVQMSVTNIGSSGLASKLNENNTDHNIESEMDDNKSNDINEDILKMVDPEDSVNKDVHKIVNTDSPKKSIKTVNKKINNKPSKKEKHVPKKQINNRKRRIVDSDDSDDNLVESGGRNSKLARSHHHDSDEEIVQLHDSITADESVEEICDPKPVDKVKLLQSYNSDIRSSLVLSHEDYDKCLARFNCLCTMDIDLMSLVTVWQLMDTVKKCRRYKRNEKIKSEAQNVYKRFLDIHSQSSLDELQRAQAILAQCRHSYNMGSKGDSVMNGHTQNLSMPLSVDDMFQSLKHSDNKAKETSAEMITCHAPVTVKSCSPPPPAPVQSAQPPPTISDEERMRLLSVDLEAKVSDILNKIEKNSVMNPINRQSMSHLLPTMSGDSLLSLPVEWESVDRRGKVDEEDDDDDEVDEDEIVKRIDNVPIKATEEEEEIDYDGSEPLEDVAGSSALDARIENLFNNSFVSGKDAGPGTTAGSSDPAGTKRQVKAMSNRVVAATATTNTITRIPGLSVSPSPISSEKASPVLVPLVLEPDAAMVVNLAGSTTADDTDIYDLLGV